MSGTSYVRIFYGIIISAEKAKEFNFESPNKNIILFNDNCEEEGNWCLGVILESMYCRDHCLYENEEWVGIEEDRGVEINQVFCDKILRQYSSKKPKLHLYIFPEY